MKIPYIIGLGFSTVTRTVQLYCEEKRIRYDTGMSYQGKEITLHDPTHYSLHPFGKIPIFLYQDQCVIETLSICHYIDRTFSHAKNHSASANEQTLIDQWANLLMNYFDPVLIRQYLLEFVFPKGDDKQIRWQHIKIIEPQVIRLIQLLEKQSQQHSYFVTPYFTMVDAILLPMLDYLIKLPHAQPFLEQATSLKNYYQRMQALTFVKKYLSK